MVLIVLPNETTILWMWIQPLVRHMTVILGFHRLIFETDRLILPPITMHQNIDYTTGHSHERLA